MSAWQPISTAPKATRVLVADAPFGYGILTAKCNAGFWSSDPPHDCGGTRYLDPKHWQPLPEKPE